MFPEVSVPFPRATRARNYRASSVEEFDMTGSWNLTRTRALVAFSIVGGGAVIGLAISFGAMALNVPTPLAGFVGNGAMLGIFYFGTRKAMRAGL